MHSRLHFVLRHNDGINTTYYRITRGILYKSIHSDDIQDETQRRHSRRDKHDDKQHTKRNGDKQDKTKQRNTSRYKTDDMQVVTKS